MINDRSRIKKISIFLCFAVPLIIAGVLLASYFIEKSKYTTIDNFNDYYYNVPEETKKIIFSNLKDTIKSNISQNIPDSGALIRDTEPYLYNYNVKYNGYSGEFTVDIPSIQQSYLVKFNFNEDPSSFMGGYAVLVYCLPEDKMIYPDFNCKENLPFVTEND